MYFEKEVGLIWDIDGVVADSPHEQAWRVTANNWGIKNFTSEFYMNWVASRPRYEGGNNILEKYGIYRELGANTKEERQRILERFCSQKNTLIKQLIAKRQFSVFRDAVSLVLEAKSHGVKQAAVSASKNAKSMLINIDVYQVQKASGKQYDFVTPSTTLYSIFDVGICGIEKGGKLEILRVAAEQLKQKSKEIKWFIVFEDAPVGIKAAKLANMFGVGIMRIGSEKDFRNAGADIVVNDLNELPYDDLKQQFIERHLPR